MTSKTIKNTPPTSAPYPQLSSITPDGVTGKIFGPNSIFGPKLGITEMPEATNILNTAIKVPR
jgi:hypothetical protein